jgi:hypothetical protein
MIHDISLYNHNICEGAENSPLDFHSERQDKNAILYKGSKIFLQYSHYNKEHNDLRLYLLQKYSADESNNLFIINILKSNFSCHIKVDLSQENSMKIEQEALFIFDQDRKYEDDAIAFGMQCAETANEVITDFINILN